ncbi:MAG: hypothetical protein JRH20_08480 [Deltaproteobacteria bacterium]|nr:hypothetical protein [Deltaproteobacteria bacterium]
MLNHSTRFNHSTRACLLIISLAAVAAPSVGQAAENTFSLKRANRALNKYKLYRVGKIAGRKTGRVLKRAGNLASGHFTLLADKVERKLKPAQTANFRKMRLFDPLAATNFLAKKIKEEPIMWTWVPASLTVSNGMHYWLAVKAAMGVGPAAVIRIPAGLALDATAITAWLHHKAKQLNPNQTISQTVSGLKAEYIQFAQKERQENRALMQAEHAEK